MKCDVKNLGSGFLYFYLHFVAEVICFFVLGRYIESPPIMWIIFFAYDMLAFVPQAFMGYFCDKFPKIHLGIVGLVLLALALVLQNVLTTPFVSLAILCIGNAFVHVNGAEVTLRVADGKISQSAIFVSGGSFGVLCGKLLSKTEMPYWMLVILIVSAIPFAILAQMDLKETEKKCDFPCLAFRYHNEKVNRYLVVFLAFFVVCVRGYMAYGIPTSWNKTTFQTVLLFTFMGIGKALGGVLVDILGARKVSIISLLCALPLMMFGDNNMFISLIGVMFFSMTMSITLAILVSALPKAPGLAFGLTTIGLFVGTIPVFFFKVKSLTANCIMLSVMTAICLVCLMISLRKDVANE